MAYRRRSTSLLSGRRASVSSRVCESPYGSLRRGVNDFFEELGRRLVAVAEQEGARIDRPELSPPLEEELLALARGVAHQGERRFAPLATYLLGVAVGRLEGSGGDAMAYVRKVRLELERDQTAVTDDKQA
jgi:Domain of unknown function (DUF6457)